MLLSICLVFVNFSLGLRIKVLLIKQKTYNIIRPFGDMFPRKVRSEEMKRYTLVGHIEQENVRFVKNKIFARALQFCLSHCQK